MTTGATHSFADKMEKPYREVESGKRCPVGGIWKIAGGTGTTTCPVAKGEVMPHYCGRKVKWLLLYTA